MKEFEYTYSAPTEEERKEIENIRREYSACDKARSDIEMLKKLDFKVKNPPLVLALTLGICATLIFGLGLTFILEWEKPFGSVIGAAGIILAAVNPFIYKAFLSARKNKYKEEILSLADKLLNENKE